MQKQNEMQELLEIVKKSCREADKKREERKKLRDTYSAKIKELKKTLKA